MRRSSAALAVLVAGVTSAGCLVAPDMPAGGTDPDGCIPAAATGGALLAVEPGAAERDSVYRLGSVDGHAVVWRFEQGRIGSRCPTETRELATELASPVLGSLGFERVSPTDERIYALLSDQDHTAAELHRLDPTGADDVVIANGLAPTSPKTSDPNIEQNTEGFVTYTPANRGLWFGGGAALGFLDTTQPFDDTAQPIAATVGEPAYGVAPLRGEAAGAKPATLVASLGLHGLAVTTTSSMVEVAMTTGEPLGTCGSPRCSALFYRTLTHAAGSTVALVAARRMGAMVDHPLVLIHDGGTTTRYDLPTTLSPTGYTLVDADLVAVDAVHVVVAMLWRDPAVGSGKQPYLLRIRLDPDGSSPSEQPTVEGQGLVFDEARRLAMVQSTTGPQLWLVSDRPGAVSAECVPVGSGTCP